MMNATPATVVREFREDFDVTDFEAEGMIWLQTSLPPFADESSYVYLCRLLDRVRKVIAAVDLAATWE